jgi:hypothetical protein
VRTAFPATITAPYLPEQGSPSAEFLPRWLARFLPPWHRGKARIASRALIIVQFS